MAFESINPASGEVVERFDSMRGEALEAAVSGCLLAQHGWASTAIAERAGPMRKLAKLLLDNKSDCARLMAVEMGKPQPQGIAEIEKCAWICDFYAEHAAAFLAAEDIETDARHSFVSYRPLGVVLAIMPWNFPFWQVMRCAVPALMAGNGVVLKHASSVFGCALRIEALFAEAGFPDQLFRSLLIDVPQTTGVIHDSRIAAVSVTASVAAGRAVAGEAGRALKKCVLELGGSDPFIVLEDANLEKAVRTGVTARFQNSGQSCIAAKRFIVVDAVYEAFQQRFTEAVGRLKVGDPMQEGIDVGPLARRDLRDALHDQVSRSVAAGARVLAGGELPQGPGAYYPPTVLTDVAPGMPAWSEELFGPVATLIRVADEREAIEVANATEFGLGGSVWTADVARGQRIADIEIQSGAAFVNDMPKSDPRMPFGGIRSSGYGRELSVHGIREFVNVHSVSVYDP
jgi:succinate-semialdehyde dehydrogenase/glutarate-semialdehyde dehydrogenase